MFRLYQNCLTKDVETNIADWTNAAGISFNVTYWPFIQGTTTSSCMYNVFYLSPTQMVKEVATYAKIILAGWAFMLTVFLVL